LDDQAGRLEPGDRVQPDDRGSAAELDPRFEARLIALERERQRRRTVLLFTALGIVALVALVSVVARAAIFDVDRVLVRGTNHETDDAVLAAARIRPGTAIWSVDIGAVERRVERLPWVQDASVRRRWPDGIVITISEYAATAYVRRDGETVALLGADGRVLADDGTAPPGLIEVVGVRKVPDPGDVLFPPGVGALTVEIPPGLAARVTAIDVSDGVDLVLATGGRVRLCQASDLAAKGTVALALIEQHGGAFEYIDVCVPDAPTMR
jgi:cell division protein FtsQ